MSYFAARNPVEHAQSIADNAAHAWYGHPGSGDLEVPVSVVAALCLVGVDWHERHALAKRVTKLSPDEFAGEIGSLWRQYLMLRPDMANRVWPLMEWWVSDEPRMTEQKLGAAKAVADTVLRHDLLALTRSGGLLEVDLLGMVLTALRPTSALQGRGQYYTPGPLAELMAAVLNIEHGESVSDPACGTGGMFRAAAAAMRGAGRDPADVYWEGNDTDYIAVACCAVNVVLWGLGHNVLLGVGDSIRNDWRERAIREREETIGIARDVRMLRALQELTAGVDKLADEQLDDQTDTEPDIEDEPEAEPAPEPDRHAEYTSTSSGMVGAIDLPAEDTETLTSDFWAMVDAVATQEK